MTSRSKLLLGFSLFLLISCEDGHRRRKGQKSHYKAWNNTDVNTSNDYSEYDSENSVLDSYFAEEVYLPFDEANGVKYVWVKINGLDKRFIFDTGASSISLSMAFAEELAQKGTISQDDILGVQTFQDATGGLSKGIRVNLHSVSIAQHSVYNVEASVCQNSNAPLLLGQSFLERFGTIEIDNRNKRIILRPK